jgi:hypothetical protein
MKTNSIYKISTSLLVACLCILNHQNLNAQPCPGSEVEIFFETITHTVNTIDLQISIKNVGTTSLKMSGLAGGFTYDPSLIPSGATFNIAVIDSPTYSQVPIPPTVQDFQGLNKISSTPALMNDTAHSQVRWAQTPIIGAPLAIPLPSNTTMKFMIMRLSLDAPYVWPPNFPAVFTWNNGLAPIFLKVNATVYCEGNTNSTSLNETTPGTATLINNTPIILNPSFAASVNYKNFNVNKTNQTATASWTTSQESNCNYYNLKKSTDGRTYTSIGRVNSKSINGNSTTDLNYSFIDENPKMGINYYQLEQVDIDGKSNTSKIVELVWNETTNPILIYPNPTNDVLNIEITTQKASQLEVKINDLNGRLVKTIKTNTIAGTNTIDVNLSEFSHAVYDVTIYENGKLKHAEKITKK